LTIWLTFTLGRRIFQEPAIALGGAVLVAASPVFLYQLMNAMSDVPVTAAWTLALVLAASRRPFGSGLAMAATIAIRPNLAPFAAVIVVWMWMSSADRGQRRRQVTRFAAGVAPAVVGIASLNAVLYESPWVSGYGTTGDLYSLGYFGTNVATYLTWMGGVETPVVAIAAVYVAAPHWWPPLRLPFSRVLLGGTMSVMLLSYVFYQPFGVWWYLRFLLPMWPAMMLATVAALDALVARGAASLRPIVMTAIVAALVWHHVQLARSRHVFDLGRIERRYVDVARFVADHTEPGAVVLSHQHSGSLRLYAGRLTLRYDVLDPAWLDRALTLLQSVGRRPYLVLDGDEVAAFRERFTGASR